MNRLPVSRTLTALLLAVVLAGCSHDKKLATSEMDDFHQLYNSDGFSKIYDTASNDFQAENVRSEFLKSIAEIHGRLGDFKTCENEKWDTSEIASQNVVTLHYRSTFEKGKADEEFRYNIYSTHAKLRFYHINSIKLDKE